MIEQTEEYKEKIALGADIYKILDEGKVEECALATDMKDALDLYMKQGNILNCMDVDLKQISAMVCIFNLDKVSLKKLFPTMNI